MANIGKFRAHESLNMDSAADWQIQTVNSITTAESYDVSNYHTVHLMSTQDIYFEFTDSSTDALATGNTLYLMGGDTIYSLKIPTGIGDTVYLLLERKGGTSCTVRYVLS